MKKLILIFICSLVACSSGEEPKKEKQEQELPITVENLLGKWQLKEIGGQVFPSSDNLFDPVPPERQFYYEFFRNGSLKTNRLIEDCYPGSFALENTTLTFEFTSCSLSYELNITSLTASKLILAGSVVEGQILYKFKKISKKTLLY